MPGVCREELKKVSYFVKAIAKSTVTTKTSLVSSYRQSQALDQALAPSIPMMPGWSNANSLRKTATLGCFVYDCYGYFDSQVSNFLSGHWIQFSRDTNVFQVWTVLKYCFIMFCIEKLALELESFCPVSSKLPDFVAGKKSKAN